MSSTTCLFGKLLQAYLFFVGMTETQLAAAIGISLNKVSAAIHGKYRLKRDYVDRILAELSKRGVGLTEEDHAELLNAWSQSMRSADS
jgi:plasmid maintenance system antidote protein VapI